MKEADVAGRTCFWGMSSGTSMAAPCVAGIVALWQEANSHLTIEQVKSIMAASADKSNNAVGIRFGNGRIDAYQGILQALSAGVDDIGLATHDIQMVANGDVYAFVSSTDSPIRISAYAMNGVEVASSAGVGMYKTAEKTVVFPVTEVVTHNEFFDYDAKYNGQVDEITPARIPDELAHKVQKMTAEIYDLIEANGIIRVDYIVTEEGEIYMLEINTTPGMTATSFIPQQIRAAQLNISDVMTEIIENSINKQF